MRTTGDSRLLDYLALFLIPVLTIPVAAAGAISDRHNMERVHASLLACKYLDAEDYQTNAYRYPELDMGFCCLCPRGTKFIGDCNPSDPTSTQCQKCNEGEHVDFEPHLQLKCEKKSWRLCFHPKVYVPGTITEADSCKCPAGTAEHGDTCVVVEALTTPLLQADISTKEAHAATESELTSVTYEPDLAINATNGSELAVWTKIKHLILNQSSAIINTTIRGSAINRIDHSSAIVWNVVVGIIAGIFVAGVVILLAALRLGIWKPWKCSKPKTTELTERLDSSMDSSRDTVGTETDVDSACVPKMDKRNSCNTDSNRSSPTIAGRNSRAEEMPLICPTEVLVERCVPPDRSPPPSLNMSGSRKQDKSPSTNEREDIRRKAGRIPIKDHRQFACDVATKLGQECRRGHILWMFRLICGSDDEVELKDLDQNERSSREFLYQCMLLALTRIGPENLSPFFLWDKISAMAYDRYTEIVSDEIENYFQNNLRS